MIKKCALTAGLVAAAVGMTMQVWADDANDKMGSNPNPTYATGASNNSTGTVDSSATQTVPSGKRHRTHKKHGTQAESSDANKTINAGDVTPSK